MPPRSKIPAKPPVKSMAKSTAKQQLLRQLICSDAPEQALRYRGARSIAGVDEVGRGALFGPVVAAAVILPKSLASLARAGLTDSKQLTREQRESLDKKIRRMAICIAVAEIDAATIDRVNIYQATRLAMLSAVTALTITPDHLLIDAMRVDHPCPQTRLIYGDSLSLSIAAASVVAKVHRDALMRTLHDLHPQYGLGSHKGYATPEHRLALQTHGATPLHRRTFAPVRAVCPEFLIDPSLIVDPDGLLEAELDTPEVLFDDLTIPDVQITLTTEISGESAQWD